MNYHSNEFKNVLQGRSISGDNLMQLDEVATAFNEEYASLCEVKKYAEQAVRPAEIEHYENLRMQAVMAYHYYRANLTENTHFHGNDYEFELSDCKYALKVVAKYYYETFYTEDGEFGNELFMWFVDFGDLPSELTPLDLPVPVSAKMYFMNKSGFNENADEQDFREHLMHLYYGTELS